jgi:hypothetical protein
VVEAGGAPTGGGSAGSAGFAPFEPEPMPGVAGQPAMNLCRTCVGHDLYECDEQGEPLGLVQSCLPYLHCEEIETQRATCAMNDCIPASKACFGNEVRTCGDDGALPTTGIDCGEKRCFLGECHDKLCDTDGKMQARAAVHPGDVELVMSSVNKLAGARIKIAVKKG